MSHLHIPDGVIPPIWLFVGFAGTGLLLAVALKMLSSEGTKHKAAWIAGASAFMLLAMSVPIPLGAVPVHLNLMAMTGILLGVWPGVVAAFVTNLILALLGHGGITVIGLNTLVTSSEVITANLLFRLLRRKLSPGGAAGVSCAFALALSGVLTAGILTLTGAEFHHEPEVLQPAFSAGRFLAVAAPVLGLGTLLESAVTALVVSYLAKVRPALVTRER